MSGTREYRRLESVQNVNLPIGIKNAKAIPLTQNQVAIVDEDDYVRLMKWKWQATLKKGENTYYASRSFWSGNKHRTTTMHREIMGLENGDKKIIDHINRNGLDNRKENLRVTSYSINAFNSRVAIDNKSGFRGVCWNKPQNKWTARITVNNKVIFIGHFKSILEAAYEYDLSAIKYLKEDAPLNFPKFLYEED